MLALCLVVTAGACSDSPDSADPTDPTELAEAPVTTAPAATPATTAPPATTGATPEPSATTSATSPAATGPVATPPTTDEGPLVPEGEGGESLGPLGDTEMEIGTDEGTVQIGTGDVPAGAADVPLPDDFEVQLSTETETDLGVSGITVLPFDDVVEFFDEALPGAGFEIIERTVQAGVFARFEVEADQRAGDVLVSTTPGSDDTTISIALATT